MRQIVASVLEVFGLAAIVGGAFLMWVPLGWVTAGLATLTVGVALDRSG